MGEALLLDVTAGPDSGRRIELLDGHHVVGRARQCRIVIDDPAIEAHHVTLSVEAGAIVAVTQLSGRQPVRHRRSAIEIGDSRLEPFVSCGGASDLGFTVTPVFDRPDIGEVLREASAANRRRYVADARAFGVRLGVGSVRVPIDLVDRQGRRVEPGALPVELQSVVQRAELLDDVPVVADLAGPAHLADIADIEPTIVGITSRNAADVRSPARAVVRSIVSQLARRESPDTWALAPIGWRGARWTTRGVDVIDDLGVLGGRRAVIVSDRPGLVRGVESPLEALRRAGVPTTMIVVAEPDSSVLTACTSVLAIGARWRARWFDVAAGGSGQALHLHAAGLSHSTVDSSGPFVAEQVPRALSEIGSGIVGVPQPARRQ